MQMVNLMVALRFGCSVHTSALLKQLECSRICRCTAPGNAYSAALDTQFNSQRRFLQVGFPLEIGATGVYTPDPASTRGFDIGRTFGSKRRAEGQMGPAVWAFTVIKGFDFKEGTNPMNYTVRPPVCSARARSC